MNEVQASVFGVIAETAGTDVMLIESATTISDLGIASLDAIEMLFRIEEKFNIELNDRDVELKAATAGMLVDAVERALHRKSADRAAATPGR